MKESDVNRKVRIFDRKDGKGLVGVITQIITTTSLRFLTDSGREYLFSTDGEMAVQVQFLDGDSQ